MNKIVGLVLLFVALARSQTSAPKNYTSGYDKIPSNFNISEYIGEGWPIPKSGAPDVVGAFRFICNPSHLSYDDPIVYPGQAGKGKSHLHQWYGNTMANGDSTYETLRKTGNSTCANILNRSAYWMPAMMNGKGGVVRPDYISIYYKNRPKNDPYCQVEGKACIGIPRGLRFIFGYDLVSGKAATGSGYFNCDGGNATGGHYPDIVTAGQYCPMGSKLGAVISAPSCWDGINLDSPNHRDHVAYGSYTQPNGEFKCPPTHPWVIPTFTLGAWYTVDEDLDKSGKWNNATYKPSTWYLSSDEMADGSMMTPGSTFHADWFGAWDDTTMEMWQDHCIDKFLNCNSGDLGNGKRMIRYPEFSWEANPRVVPVPVKPTGSPNSPNSPSTTVAPADDDKSSSAVKLFSSLVLSISLLALF